MRERELERAEMAKISLQADRAESALTQLKKEATQVTISTIGYMQIYYILTFLITNVYVMYIRLPYPKVL